MRVIIASLTLSFMVAAGAQAQSVSGFTVAAGGAVALLGCDVSAPGGLEVAFAQVADGVSGRSFIGTDGFEGDACADALSALLDRGFRLLASRPVLQSPGREIIVYDLIGE